MDPQITKQANEIQSIWAKKEKEYQQKMNNFTKAFFENFTGVTLEFNCKITGQVLDIPVYFNGCKSGDGRLKHFENAYDLTQLLIYLKNQSTDTCPQCDSYIGDPKDSIRPHYFYMHLRAQFGKFPRSVFYIHEGQLSIPEYQNKKIKDYFNSNQRIIVNIFRQPKSLDLQFKALAQYKKELNDIIFTNICYLGGMRVNIPVRGRKCQHYELFDLVYLLKYIENNNQKQNYQCPYPYCTSIFEFQNMNSFVIDFDVLEATMKGISFSMKLTYSQIFKKLQDPLDSCDNDLTIQAYENYQKQEDKMKYIQEIYQYAEKIFQNESNSTKTKVFYQNFDLNNAKQLQFRCKFTNCMIEIPARCNNCTSIDICDLRYFVCILQDQNSKKVCPLCKNDLKKAKKGPPTPLFESIYVDTKLMSFILKTNQFQRTIENFQAQQSGQENNQNIFDTYVPQQPKKIVFTQQQQQTTQQQDYSQIQEMIANQITLSFGNFNRECLITKNKITIPIRTKACTHLSAFDLNSIRSLCEQGKANLSVLQCPACNTVLKDVDNLYIDKYLLKAIQQLEGTQWNILSYAPKTGKVYGST